MFYGADREADTGKISPGSSNLFGIPPASSQRTTGLTGSSRLFLFKYTRDHHSLQKWKLALTHSKPDSSVRSKMLRSAVSVYHTSCHLFKLTVYQIAGMISKVFEHPFDLCKVRLQTQVMDQTARFDGPIHCLTETWRNEGFTGLYRVCNLMYNRSSSDRLLGLARSDCRSNGRTGIAVPNLQRISTFDTTKHWPATLSRPLTSSTCISRGRRWRHHQFFLVCLLGYSTLLEFHLYFSQNTDRTCQV